MESNLSSELRVGLFVAIGTLALLGSIMFFGGDQMFLARTYQLKVKLSDVQGLATGSVVSLGGLTVGSVRRIDFAPGTTEIEVVLGINKRFASRITQDSTATARTQGALGDRYIYIEPGSPNQPPLKNGEFITALHRPDILEMISSKGSELSNVTDVISEVHNLLLAFNQDQRSAHLMINLLGATSELQLLVKELRGTLSEVRSEDSKAHLSESLQHLHSILRKIDQGEGTLGALVNDPSLHNRISSMVGADSPRQRFLRPLIRATMKSEE